MIFGVLLLTMAAAHAGARPPAAKIDACRVLTRGDLAAVQGEAFTEAKVTTRGTTSQCFYQLPTFVKSVSLDVTRGGGRAWWRQHFEEHRQDADAREEHEEGEAKRPPQRVRGVGDEAFWVGSRMAGSLYVLKGDSILRVSAGGPGSEGEKIARSKSLARRALRRM